MSSSDEDDAFNVKALMRKQKKKASNEKQTLTTDDFSCDLDDILDKEKVLNDRIKTDSEDSDTSNDESGKSLTAIERIRMKKRRNMAKAAQIEKAPEPMSPTSSSSDEDSKRTLRRSARNRKRQNELDSTTSSVECSVENATCKSPARKKISPSKPQDSDDEICVLSGTMNNVRSFSPEPEEEDMMTVGDGDILEVRYLVKDLSDKSIASFFYPADVKVNDIREKFKNKLDPTLPYLYFFTEDLDPIDPEKTPIELGWNLSQVHTVRIRQSSHVSFFLAQKQKPKAASDEPCADSVDDGRIQIKFQIKDRHKPFKVLIDPADTFGKIKADFCKEQKLDASRCFLIFDNERVADTDTPNDYEMEKNDCVDVHVG
ncbi:hypothetical protein QR680_007826 [Steinernema hermaphroditum]|uniref:Ubiquitin-like domain-containing protein n=1 Tax=Steinernema hermaphroditum TaxID=289476 RepID=A0AA39M706_9BILA|nr:hypothetical protein QR680_007826 [Steinernema hermaphroditum]